MATASTSPPSTSSEQPQPASQPTDIPSAPLPSIPHLTDEVPSSTPLEMSSLHATAPSADSNPSESTSNAQQLPTATSTEQNPEDKSNERRADAAVASDMPADAKAEDARSAAAPSRPRKESSAIGPDTDGPIGPLDSSAGPAVVITLLLISGARHPYRIDEAYLKKRNIAAADEAAVDPFSISIYTMKELIWRDWRAEWEPRPSSPSSIRLIHFGKLLNDKAALAEYFKPEMPNVVHMSVRPHDFADDDDTGKASQHREHDEEEEQPGCCRCVIL